MTIPPSFSTATFTQGSGGARKEAQTGDLWQPAWPASRTQHQKGITWTNGLQQQNGTDSLLWSLLLHHQLGKRISSCIEKGRSGPRRSTRYL